MVRTLFFHCCGPGFNTVSRRAVWPVGGGKHLLFSHWVSVSGEAKWRHKLIYRKVLKMLTNYWGFNCNVFSSSWLIGRSGMDEPIQEGKRVQVWK